MKGKEFKIKPYKSVGPIEFGHTRDQVRAVLPYKMKTFYKAEQSEMETDAFNEIGVHVCYKRTGGCEAVEFFPPAKPQLNGVDMVGQPFASVRDFLRRLDPEIEVDESGLTSYKLGIALYAPSHKENPDTAVESVLVFERGYYDSVG